MQVHVLARVPVPVLSLVAWVAAKGSQMDPRVDDAKSVPTEARASKSVVEAGTTIPPAVRRRETESRRFFANRFLEVDPVATQWSAR
jgi:hypothetical protein